MNRSGRSDQWANGKIQHAPEQQRVFVFEQITWPLKDGTQEG